MVIEMNAMGSIHWLFTQLKEDYIANQSHIFESFMRTKKWVIINCPESLL
jgi:hypothetical protein